MLTDLRQELDIGGEAHVELLDRVLQDDRIMKLRQAVADL